MTRILVVDDSAGVRALIVAVLSRQADMCVIGSACNGEEGVEMSANLCPDVVTMDSSMPRMDGFEAVRRITRQGNGIRVVGVSSHDDRASVHQMLGAGASGYVCKWDLTQELVSAIRAVAQGELYFSALVAEVGTSFVRDKMKQSLAAGSPV